MKKLKGVCVGAGYFSQFHFDAWQRIDSVELMAVCDLDLKKAEAVSKTYGFERAYSDVEMMLKQERPDFIDIITPPVTHLELCRLAIKHHVQIICQKPLAPTNEEARTIAQEIAASGVRMMVHENFRFQPWHREIKKLLEQQIIGDKLFTINLRMRTGDGWQQDAYMNRQPYFREMEKLLIYETGIHFIDVFQYFGGKITRVYSKLQTLNPNIKGEDFAWVHFEFANGMLGFLDANRYNQSTAENPRFTFGNLLIEGNQGSIRLYEDGRITVQLLGEPEQPHNYPFVDRNFAGDCVLATQKHFVNCLINQQPFETDVAGYLSNLQVQEAVYESAAANREITVSP